MVKKFEIGETVIDTTNSQVCEIIDERFIAKMELTRSPSGEIRVAKLGWWFKLDYDGHMTHQDILRKYYPPNELVDWDEMMDDLNEELLNEN